MARSGLKQVRAVLATFKVDEQVGACQAFKWLAAAGDALRHLTLWRLTQIGYILDVLERHCLEEPSELQTRRPSYDALVRHVVALSAELPCSDGAESTSSC